MLKYTKASVAFVLLAGVCALQGAVPREAGLFFIQTWAPKTYGASPQNWAIAQDRRGVMYFGNTDGLLEYDGVSWRKIRVPNGSAVRSLAVDGNGTVFVGAQRDFGYLRPDAHDDLQYVSLLASVPEADRGFGDVWTIATTPQGVYFGTSRKIFRWNFGTMKAWNPPHQDGRFGRLTIAGDVPYALVVGQGLFRLTNDSWEAAPGGDRFAKEDIRSIYLIDGSLLVVTRNALYRQSAGAFEKLATGSSKIIEAAQVYASLMLSNGDLALATSHGGLLLVNSRGDVERSAATAEGLAAEKVNAIFTDRQGGIWMALESGLARLDLTITQFDKRVGLNGSVYAIARDGESFFAGTTGGVFRLKPSADSAASFEPLKGLEDTILAMLPSPGGLLIGGQRGLYQIVKRQPKLVLKIDSVADLQISPRDPAVLYAAGRSSLSLLRRTDNKQDDWHKEKEVSSGGKEFRTVVEDSDGRVWATTLVDVARVDFSTDPPSVERFGANQGVPIDGWKNAYVINGRVLFATRKGLLHFDANERVFKPDSSLGEQFSDGSRAVSILRESPNGDIWVTGEGYQGILERRPGGGYDWAPMPLLRTGIGELYALWLDADGVAWAAGMDGWLARYAAPAAARQTDEFSVLLRRVQRPGSDTALFSGAGAGAASAIKLLYRDNSLRFEFAAPAYEAEGTIEYQVFLEGADRGWSPWTTETRKDYTNILEGNYSFHVRARNPHGQVAEAAVFGFSVAPPWYRTWWAILLYLAAAAAAIWLLLRWRLAQLSARNQQLEQIVEERTVEIRRQRDQIQIEEEKTKGLLLNILPALVADELRTTGSVAPMVFNEVTVCFTDFVGFTLSAEKISAQVLVSTLHEYFTAFDDIVTRYGLEKLKTIGDSYMFVSGMPNVRKSHALDATMAAMEMLDLCQRMERSDSPVAWKVRIGLHTGSVVAGVVGVRKFAFDIWGNTVNLASRMESTGESERVNISARTHECIRDFIDCESRGLVATKDGRSFEMYFTRDLRGEVADPEEFARRYRAAFSEEPWGSPALFSRDTLASPSDISPTDSVRISQ
jgi:class 3 adenylate cyclase